MSGVSSCGGEVDLSAFDITRVEYKIDITLHAGDKSRLGLTYVGEHDNLDDALDSADAALATLVGCVEARS